MPDGGSGSETCELYGNFGRYFITDASGDDWLIFESWDGLIIDLTSYAKPNVRKKTRAGPVDWEGAVIEDASGSYGNDRMIGNDAPNWIPTREANNDITGGGGADTIWSEGGGTLSGGEGDDDIEGGSGDGIINGGPGDDTISAGVGFDTIACGEGIDVAYLDPRAPEPVNCETVDRY